MATNVTLPDFNVTPNITIDGYYSGFRYKTGEYTVSGDGFKDVVIEYDSTSSKGTSITSSNYKLNNTTNLVGVKFTDNCGELPAFDTGKFKGIENAFCEAGTINYGGDPTVTFTAGTYYIWFRTADLTLYWSTTKPSSYNATGNRIKSYTYPIGYSPRCVKFRMGFCGGGGGGEGGWKKNLVKTGGGAGGGGGSCQTCMTFYAIACTEATKSDFYYVVVSVGSGGAGHLGTNGKNSGNSGGGTSIGWGNPSKHLGTWGAVTGGGGGSEGSGGGPGGWDGTGYYPSALFPYNSDSFKEDSPGMWVSGCYGGNTDEAGDGLSWAPPKAIDIKYPWNTSSSISRSGGSTPGLGGGGGASAFGSGGSGGGSDYNGSGGGYGAGGGGGSFARFGNSTDGGNGGSGVCYLWV